MPNFKYNWQQARKKNPLVKRNAWVSYKGRNFRVAAIDNLGHVVLRHEIIVHPADIEKPKDD